MSDTQFLSVDANFKCGLKDKGLRDIELAPGWAYMVEEGHFQAHIANYYDQQEVSMEHFIRVRCVTFAWLL
jgi:hypothetical protein